MLFRTILASAGAIYTLAESNAYWWSRYSQDEINRDGERIFAEGGLVSITLAVVVGAVIWWGVGRLPWQEDQRPPLVTGKSSPMTLFIRYAIGLVLLFYGCVTIGFYLWVQFSLGQLPTSIELGYLGIYLLIVIAGVGLLKPLIDTYKNR